MLALNINKFRNILDTYFIKYGMLAALAVQL